MTLTLKQMGGAWKIRTPAEYVVGKVPRKNISSIPASAVVALNMSIRTA